jgi:acyl-CoA reductase-like NAD-dependent aldehyde dehydrogenase
VSGADRFAVHYPCTGEVIGSAPRLSRAEVGRVLDRAATRRFDLSRYERSHILHRIADLLAAEADDFATLITLESGLALLGTREAAPHFMTLRRVALPIYRSTRSSSWA